LKGIHNRSQAILSPEQQKVLNLGLKFMPTPAPPDSEMLKPSMSDWHRKLRLKCFHIVNSESDSSNNRAANFNVKWWLPGQSSFTPDLAELTPQMAQTLSGLEDDGFKLINQEIPPHHFTNISKRQLHILKKLAADPSLVIKPADKNLGKRSAYALSQLKLQFSGCLRHSNFNYPSEIEIAQNAASRRARDHSSNGFLPDELH